jgi:hypothetical protein
LRRADQVVIFPVPAPAVTIDFTFAEGSAWYA